eukprot:CCRYP_001358-RA/>CCRYP_001358-RA protein AED:0.08 eAED:0.05 QI:0/0/0/1/0/0/4/0/1076
MRATIHSSRYHVPTPTHIREHLQASLQCNTDHILNVYELPSIEQSIRYLHAAAGFPTKSTWLAAIRKGNYSTWPLITVKNVHKHFPQSEETQQGHMRNQRQGTRSTKQALPQAEPRTPLPQLHDIFIRTYDTHGTLYTDQTGKFPHLSSQGNRYQMILYHVDSNSIWAEPTKNKTEGELILARNRALQRMKACGIQPTRQVLDNEISAAYKLAITASGMTYQLVPPGDHRRNIAEKAIQTWKDHFIAVISGTGAKFPLHLWCQLLPQMERQLCLLRQSNAYPHISSHAHLYGHHDYNAHPFVPLGMEALVHDKPHRRKSFAQHCTKGYVIGTSHEHYRCWKVWTPTSRTTRISATVFFKHKYITNPSVTPADAIIAAAANLSHLLTNNLQAHHNNKVNQSDLTRLQILTQPSPPRNTMQHIINNTHQTPTRPSSPAAVSDYDSDSSDSDDESITIPHPHPHPPRHTTRAVAHIQSHRKPSYTCSTTPEHRSHHDAQQPDSFHVRPSQPYSTPTLENSSSIATSSKPKIQHHMEKCIWQRTRSPRPRYPGTVKGTNTIVFIAYNEIPPQRRRHLRTHRCQLPTEKEDPYRIRLTVGGNRITYPGDCGTPTADMLTTKILLNSVISTKGARFMTIDIKDFYLNTPMVRPEYMRLKLSDIPDHIIKLYKLDKLVTTDGYVYVLIQKECTVSHRRASSLNNSLKKGWPSKATGKVPSHLVSGNTTGALSPSLYHLLQTLNEHYETSQDWKGERYLGLTIAWDYTLQQVQLSMPGYCKKAGHRFHHPVPIKPQHQPYPHTPRTYGAKQQFVDTADDSALLSNTDKTFVQEVIGVFLYYARAVDCTMLPALGSLATQQSAPTQNTMSKIHQFLDYAMTHPDAMITYRASNMILAVHSDASYLSETKARSRAGGHFFLSEDDPSPRNNGAILTLAQIIKPVMSSAAEAELGALYINARRQYHNDTFSMNWDIHNLQLPYKLTTPQPLEWSPTSSNPNAPKQWTCVFIGSVVEKIKNSFAPIGAAGTTNLADYVTKHHPAIHHQAVRHIYLSTPTKLLLLRNKAHNILKVATTLPTLTPHACAA